MKVFTVKKENEDEITNVPKEKGSYIKVENEDKFNYIVIKNPSDSNKICVVKSIRILNKGKANEVCLMQGEEEMLGGRGQLKFIDNVGMLSIEGRIEKHENDMKVELSRRELWENEECNILGDSVLIMLPKGCLFIRLNREVSSFEMHIDWTSEEIL